MFFKKKLFLMGLVCSLAVPAVASAEGFGINEWSAEGVAMGGARMFAPPGSDVYGFIRVFSAREEMTLDPLLLEPPQSSGLRQHSAQTRAAASSSFDCGTDQCSR